MAAAISMKSLATNRYFGELPPPYLKCFTGTADSAGDAVPAEQLALIVKTVELYMEIFYELRCETNATNANLKYKSGHRLAGEWHRRCREHWMSAAAHEDVKRVYGDDEQFRAASAAYFYFTVESACREAVIRVSILPKPKINEEAAARLWDENNCIYYIGGYIVRSLGVRYTKTRDSEAAHDASDGATTRATSGAGKLAVLSGMQSKDVVKIKKNIKEAKVCLNKDWHDKADGGDAYLTYIEKPLSMYLIFMYASAAHLLTKEGFASCTYVGSTGNREFIASLKEAMDGSTRGNQVWNDVVVPMLKATGG